MTDTHAYDEQPSGARPGIVYVLTNDSIPGLVKIGRTSRNADLRASELWQTGVPTRFEVYCAIRTINCVELEAFVHGDLRRQRVHKNREFFAVDPEVAKQKIVFWACHQAHNLVNEHFDFVATEHFSTWVPGSVVERLAAETGQPNLVVVEALQCVTSEEVAAPIQRVRAKMEAEHRALLISLDIPEHEHWSVFE